MMLWISNLIAYSVQLAVLVGAAAWVAALLHLHRPVAALRFWQGVFGAALLWPLLQVWGSAPVGDRMLGPHAVKSVAGWAASPSAAEPLGLAPIIILVGVTAAGAGALYRLARIVMGLHALRIIRARSVPASSLAPIASALQNQLATRADIRWTTRVTSPATYGVVRPTVLLPRCVEQLPRDMQQAILCHELMHVSRRDWLATMLEQVWSAVLWFHPAARALVSQLAFIRETVVDQATIAHLGNRRAYAAALLAFAGAAPPAPATAAFIGRRFEDRILLIAQEEPVNRTALPLRMCVAAFTVAAATVVATMLAPLSASTGTHEQTVYKPGDGVTLPRVIKEVKPEYTPEALRARIQGDVWLNVVVLPSGTVGEITVEKSLDREHGLDERAIEAVRQWTFDAGTKDGKPVAVEVTVQMTFTLK
jgi:TonB family protein